MSLSQLREYLESTGLVRRLVQLARDEDLGPDGLDVTSVVCGGKGLPVQARIVARSAGVAAGLGFVGAVLDQFAQSVLFHRLVDDGRSFEAGQTLGTLYGSRQQILAAERTILNLLGRLCGIATHTARVVEAMGGGEAPGPVGTGVILLDTRKTTPGLRVFEKYAVRCGGGHCHRLGLHDAVLIKDNHLEGMGAGMGRSDLRADERHFQREGHEEREVQKDRDEAKEAQAQARAPGTPNPQAATRLDLQLARIGDAVERAAREAKERNPAPAFVEVEADSLEQVAAFLAIESGLIDIILLDNMPPTVLRQAIALRDRVNPSVLLEASGGITLDTIGAVAATGIDRISCGSLTHGAVWIDVGLDMGESIKLSETGAGEG